SVGVVRDAVIAWRVAHGAADATGAWWSLPVVAETWDGWLNDINGFHVRPEHALRALDSAHSGAVEEGSVGGGTGMICNGFKGGIGTSSRKLAEKDGGYLVGVLVQCNYGRRQNLRIAGIPVGREIESEDPYASLPSEASERGSIIVVVATNAPLLPHQLKRGACRSASGGPAALRATAPATSSLRSRPRTPRRATSATWSTSGWCRTTRWIRSSPRPCRPPRKPSLTPWWPRKT